MTGVFGSDRAVSFGGVAEHYDRYRPAPPAEVAEWLLPPGVESVTDLCAGTGSFSRLLAHYARRVVAVDLDVRMLAVLSERTPTPGAVCAVGEVLPFRGVVFDAVVVSSGWHWLDPDRAIPEIARVLRPGGILGVVWNGPNRRVDWVGELLGRRRGREGRPDRRRRQLVIPPGAPFTEPQQWVIDWTLPRTPAELIGLAGTYSGVITSGHGEQQALVQHCAAVIEQDRVLRGRTRVDLPMSARCWRATRI